MSAGPSSSAAAASSAASASGGAPCTHPVQVSGLCAICGVELETLPPDERPEATEDEPVSILHSHAALKVTRSEAARLHAETTSQLLNTRRLALIVDLDQTVIHATVDPTVGEWIKDESNPNHSALRDVERFFLGMDGKPVPLRSGAMKRAEAAQAKAARATLQRKSADKTANRTGSADQNGSEHAPDADKDVASDKEQKQGESSQHENAGDDTDHESDDEPWFGCWYYIKPRPGLREFLRQVSQLYELHVYTMGTRSYAASVCAIIDPDGTLFGDRILSRDENDDGASAALAGNSAAAAAAAFRKSLARLFPVDTSMVVIIDDRADVWKWSPNLVKVVPFDFFVGIGDINASFLPATPTAQMQTPPATEAAEGGAVIAEVADAATVPVDGLAGENGADAAQRAALEQQTSERPLAKMQEALEGDGAAAQGSDDSSQAPSGTDASASASDSTEAAEKAEGQNQRAAVLKEDDRELERLQRLLGEIHARWYAAWAQVQEEAQKKGAGISEALTKMPDVANIIAERKAQTLKGCHIVFSGVVPLGQNAEASEPWRTATEFGARCYRDLTSSATHLVAARGRTVKVYQAQKQKHPRIWIVRPRWLTESVERWERAPESAHELLDSDDEDGGEVNGASRPSPGQAPVPSVRRSTKDDDVGEVTRADEQTEDLDEDGDTTTVGHSAGVTPTTSMTAFGGFEALDWGEAADEVDAFLEGLDDEGDTTDGGYASEDQSMSQSIHSDRQAKRSRLESEAEDSEGADGSSKSALPDARSPLSKRRKLASARAGQSKLKHSFDPSAFESDADHDDQDEDDRAANLGGLGRAGREDSESGADDDGDDEDDEGKRIAGRTGKRRRTANDGGGKDDEEDDADEDMDSAPKRHSLFQRRAAGTAGTKRATLDRDADMDEGNSARQGHVPSSEPEEDGDDDADDDHASLASQVDDSFLDGLADEIALDLEEGD